MSYFRTRTSNGKAKAPVRRGLSLVEMMISLAISAMLLTAIGAAYHASCSAIEMNDQFYRATQAARVSLNQILDQVRRCQSGAVDVTSLDVTTDLGEQRTYELNGTDLTMTFTPPGATAPSTYKLASNLKTLQFSTDGKSISMLVTVAVGTNQVTLCGSAFPRRLVTYN
jgi:prepilin-type N-terminal cleavage/methylation domain-containing protein